VFSKSVIVVTSLNVTARCGFSSLKRVTDGTPFALVTTDYSKTF